MGPVVVDSGIVLDKNGFGLSSQIDFISSDPYYNAGYSNFTAQIKSAPVI